MKGLAMKKLCLPICIVLLLVSLTVPVSAAVKDEAELLYNNIRVIVVGLGIDESTGIASSSGSVEAYYMVPVEVCAQLQVYKDGQWKTLMSWSNSGTGAAYAGGQYVVEPGYNYRTRVTGSICNDLGIPIESEVGTKEVYYPAS